MSRLIAEGSEGNNKELLNNNSEKARSPEGGGPMVDEAKEKERLAAAEAMQKENDSLREKVKNMEKFNCFVCNVSTIYRNSNIVIKLGILIVS